MVRQHMTHSRECKRHTPKGEREVTWNASRLFEEAAARGWNGNALARALEVHPATVTRLRQGRHAPETRLLTKISRVFGKPANDLVYLDLEDGHP
jgi:transcriptional regulator with XRE-family HTH domain